MKRIRSAVIAKCEATKIPRRPDGEIDCFASLAMTVAGKKRRARPWGRVEPRAL
jgi:hypothetical protein